MFDVAIPPKDGFDHYSDYYVDHTAGDLLFYSQGPRGSWDPPPPSLLLVGGFIMVF